MKDGVSLHLQVKMDFAELPTFRSDQIAAIMEGIGKILSSGNAGNGDIPRLASVDVCAASTAEREPAA